MVTTKNCSRICMKNIPPSFDESKIIQHLLKSWEINFKNKKLTITDCRLLRNDQGKSRNVAFIGLKNHDIAEAFILFFHHSYFLSSRVDVQYAFPKYQRNKVESDNISHSGLDIFPSSSEISLRNGNTKRMENIRRQNISLTKDRVFQNLSHMKPIAYKDKVVDNNNHVKSTNFYKKCSLQQNIGEKRKTIISPMDDNLESNRLFVKNIPYITTEIEVRELFSTFGCIIGCHLPFDDDNDDHRKNKGYAYVTFLSSKDAEKAKDTLNMTDFQGRLIYVVNAIKLVHDAPATAARTTEKYKDDYGINFKKKREDDRRNSNFYSNFGLSTTFVRSDAVIDNLSCNLGLKKREILNVKDENVSGGEAAVRMALGESYIIENNKKFFRTHGINLDNLTSKTTRTFNEDQNFDDVTAKNRSKMILMKNLPYDTCDEDIYKLLHHKGLPEISPKRILLAPSKTLCFLEYQSAIVAQKVFRKLAYRRFKNVPLYLEWVPISSKIDGFSNMLNLEQELDKTSNKTTTDNEIAKVNGDYDSQLHYGVNQTIFVKNINFETKETKLLETFEQLLGKNKIRSVRIPRKNILKKNGKDHIRDHDLKLQLSMGYGFVECSSETDVINFVKSHPSLLLDGHILRLELSSSVRNLKDTDEICPSSINIKKTKLIIRNVPFQASRRDILQLFGSFGHLKNVRLPKKFDGNHRGFAFVDFMISEEAENALQSLSGTHLYGRHLVLEWAFEDGKT